MLRLLIRKVLFNKRIAPVALRVALHAHNFLYDLCGVLAVRVNEGIHPKHDLLQYKQWFLEHIQPEFVVLDVGSNTGAMPALFATKARRVYGIEINQRLTEIARQTNAATNVEYLTGDATTFDYSACAPLDCVTLSNVIEHIDNRVEFLQMLRTKLPWHSDRATFLIRVPTIERDWLSVYKKSLGIEYRLDRTHTIEHTKQEFLVEIAAAGLEIEEMDVRFGEYYVVCHGKVS